MGDGGRCLSLGRVISLSPGGEVRRMAASESGSRLRREDADDLRRMMKIR
jgi:hypothetical protein